MSSELAVRDGPDHEAQGRQRDKPVDDVAFTLLGPLEVVKNGVNYAPSAPKILQLLALLLMRPGKVVHVDSIIAELWADEPPRSVRTTMQTYVYQLRKCIERNALAESGETLLVTRPPGYVLTIDPEQLDVTEFQTLCGQGRESMAGHRHREAARSFRSALGLWTGPALANVQCGALLTAYAVELQEQRRAAHHLRIQADIEAGNHRELIGELKFLVSTNPLDEELHGQLMRVLARSGRRSDAMETYRQLHTRLNAELGVEPCAELRSLHHGLLSAGDT
jgi:DNA-binding SARP family transcriptional activator